MVLIHRHKAGWQTPVKKGKKAHPDERQKLSKEMISAIFGDKFFLKSENAIKMKNLYMGLIGIIALASCTGGAKDQVTENCCSCDRDSMIVVMRFERKVKPEYVTLFKQSFDACKAEVMAKEPGCLDYSLFQSYHDSTLFCLTEAWATKEDHTAHMKLEHTIKHIAEIKGINDPAFKSTTNYNYRICPGANQSN